MPGIIGLPRTKTCRMMAAGRKEQMENIHSGSQCMKHLVYIQAMHLFQHLLETMHIALAKPSVYAISLCSFYTLSGETVPVLIFWLTLTVTYHIHCLMAHWYRRKSCYIATVNIPRQEIQTIPSLSNCYVQIMLFFTAYIFIL